MEFLQQLFKDSEVLNVLEHDGSNEQLLEIVISFRINLSLIEKLYEGDYDFTIKEFYILINDLNYIGNIYLNDVMSLAKYKNIRLKNLNTNLEKAYDEISISSEPFIYFAKTKNAKLVKFLREHYYDFYFDMEMAVIYGNVDIIKIISNDIPRHHLISSPYNSDINVFQYTMDGRKFHSLNNMIKKEIIKGIIASENINLLNFLKDQIMREPFEFREFCLNKSISPNKIKLVAYFLGIFGYEPKFNTIIEKFILDLIDRYCYHELEDLYELYPKILEYNFTTNPMLYSLEKTHRLFPFFLKYYDVNTTNNHGESPLIIASKKGQIESVNFLIQNGADIHVKDDAALRYAAQNGYVNIVRLLLFNGANYLARDGDARKRAEINGRREILEILDMYAEKN